MSDNTAPRMVDVLWESVFTPEELAAWPQMAASTDRYPGTDVVLCCRPQKFKTLEAVRKLFLSGKDHSGEHDVCLMRWAFKQAFPSPGAIACGAAPDVPFGYFVWYAMVRKSRLREQS